jgi:hypothetical protein
MGLVCLLALLLAASARSDTYNFYFAKPAKKPESASSPAAPATAAGTESAPAPSGTAAVAPIPGAGMPVIITNTNNIGYPPADPRSSQAGTPAPVVATPVSPSPDASLAATAALTQEPHRDPWRLGLAAAYQYGYPIGGLGEEHAWGGVISLGYFFTPAFGVVGWGGTRSQYASDLGGFAGLDLEWLPFRIGASDWQVLELGFLAGGSTLKAATGNIGTFHAGARLDLNFDKHFGLTAAVHANLGYAMLEAGLVTHF